MATVELDFNQQQATVSYKQQPIGTIDLKKNSYHSQHTYLTFHLSRYDDDLATPIFQALLHHTKCPLQAMLSSTNQTLIDFLQAGGFQRRRICYEMEVSTQDFLGNPQTPTFHIAWRPSKAYDACAELILHHYKKTHEAISPFTGSDKDFIADLPTAVYYQAGSKGYQGLAFVENNEIAYIWGEETEDLISFASQLISYLFQQYDTIIFEADDVDSCAMTLKSLFKDQTNDHWDTYILPDAN